MNKKKNIFELTRTNNYPIEEKKRIKVAELPPEGYGSAKYGFTNKTK